MNLLRALRHRNFAFFLSGQICALIGYWIQSIALAWLIYRLTGSATLLGVLSFAANLPVLLLAPFAGLWSDRFNRHRMMLATQVLETLAKTGRPSRAEITDAAMGERAECVMLNKGPHVLDAIHTLDDILRRMQAHQAKKRPLLRALRSWGASTAGRRRRTR